MHLIYLDESGNTGNNLNDTEQPIFVLGALIVPETCWQTLEAELEAAIEHSFPEVAELGLEIHAADLSSGRRHFKGVGVSERIALRDEWLRIAARNGLRFVYRKIVKTKYQRWMHSACGTGVTINPHVAAFPLVSRVVDEYLASLGNDALGMFISDDNKEIAHDVEKSIRLLRGFEGSLRLCRIVEKGFFIDSTKSRPLQLCDVCTFSARKLEEVANGGRARTVDTTGIELLKPLIHTGNEALQDVLAWLTAQQAQKSSGQGINPESADAGP